MDMVLVCTNLLILLFTLIVTGIPFWYWYVLYVSRGDISSRLQTGGQEDERRLRELRLTHIRFLFASYKPEYWYWELVETFQRIRWVSSTVLSSSNHYCHCVLRVVY